MHTYPPSKMYDKLLLYYILELIRVNSTINGVTRIQTMPIIYKLISLWPTIL